MVRFSSVFFFVASASFASAVGVVAPAGLASAPGDINNVLPFCNGGLTEPQIRYQQVFAGSTFGGPVRISGIAFRPDENPRAGFMDRLDFRVAVSLSTTSGSEDNLSTDLSANVGADVATVFDGAMTFDSGFVDAGGGTLAFDLAIPFATSFLYDPSMGNLLLEMRVDTDVDSLLTLDAGFVEGDGTSRIYSTLPNRYDNGDSYDTVGLVTRFEVEAVPEPGTVAALGLGALGLLRRRRRVGSF